MSEEPIHDTAPKATKALLGTIAFILIMVGIEALVERDGPRYVVGGSLIVVGIICSYAAVAWAVVRNRLSDSVKMRIAEVALSPRWWLATVLVGLMAVSLSPYIEQQRWPFASWFAHVFTPSVDEIAEAVVRKLPQNAPTPPFPSADDVAKSVVRPLPSIPGGHDQITKIKELSSALDLANKDRDDLSRKLTYLQKNIPQKSPRLGLDDTKRWSLAKKMMNSSGTESACRATLNLNNDQSDESKKSLEIWGEWLEIVTVAGWRFTQHNNRTFFPPGISIYVGSSTGPAFNCATRLKEFLESLNIEPVVIHPNESTQELIECKNECIQISVGKTDSP